MRLIDLHCKWLWQYATETTIFDESPFGELRDRRPQLDGYLSGTSAAVLACARRRDDWARRATDPWPSLFELVARYEAEFAGRLLIGPADAARWRSEPPNGLCWGTVGVAGFDWLVREPADLDRLPGLFKRGVRVFQLTETAMSRLAGSSDSGDDRGLEPLGLSFLEALADLSRAAAGPRAIIDLAHLNPRAMADVLAWIENRAPHRLLSTYSHGFLAHSDSGGPRDHSRERRPLTLPGRHNRADPRPAVLRAAG